MRRAASTSPASTSRERMAWDKATDVAGRVSAHNVGHRDTAWAPRGTARAAIPSGTPERLQSFYGRIHFAILTPTTDESPTNLGLHEPAALGCYRRLGFGLD